MAFYLEGGREPNPTLAASPGERLRLVLVNRDRGYAHDLRLETLGVSTRQLAGDGSADRVTLRVPEAPGEHPYVCSLHPRMMGASLVVR
jgi:plastocyanin